MSFRRRITVLTCLLFAAAGCMKAVAPEPAPVPVPSPAPVAEAERPAQPTAEELDIPEEYRIEFRSAAAEGRRPDFFLLLADRFASRGEAERGSRFFDRAAEAFAEAGNPAAEASAWAGKVLFLTDSGDGGEASALLAEGGRKWKEPPLRAFPGYLSGRRALMEGDFARAGTLLREALRDSDPFPGNPYLLRLRRDAELAAGAAAVLCSRLPALLQAYGAAPGTSAGTGRCAEGEGHLLRALDLNRALQRAKIAPFIPGADFQRCEAEAEGFLALEEGMGGRMGEAMKRFARALALSRSSGDREGEMRILLFLGELGLLGGNAVEGLRAAREFRELADRCRNDSYRIWSRLLLARHHRDRGRTGEAIAFLREADLILSLRRRGPEAERFQELCRTQKRALYEWLVGLLAAERRFAEALVFAEKAKARRFVDLLEGETLGRNPSERESVRQAAGLETEIRGLQKRLLKDSGGGASADIEDRLEAAEGQYRLLLDRIGKENEALLSLLAVREIDPAALQLLLDQDTTLFSYFVADERTYVWAIHPSNIHMERIDLTRRELRALAFSFSEAVRENSRKNTEILSRKAYDLLLQPIIPFVSGERIGFIPDDALTHLPFAALNYRGRYLVEGFAVFQLPEMRLLRRPGAVAGRPYPDILAFADSGAGGGASLLQRVIEEAEGVRKRTGRATILLERPASLRELERVAAGYDLLHFAAPVGFVPGFPLDASLRFTPDARGQDLLTVRELFALRLQTEAVVLSKCDPSKESDPDGLGLTSLQEAFLRSGSRSVTTTLWRVQGRGLGRLLGLFYGNIDRKGFPADSLRSAQLDAIREGYSPHLWAAFSLAGY